MKSLLGKFLLMIMKPVRSLSIYAKLGCHPIILVGWLTCTMSCLSCWTTLPPVNLLHYARQGDLRAVVDKPPRIGRPMKD